MSWLRRPQRLSCASNLLADLVVDPVLPYSETHPIWAAFLA